MMFLATWSVLLQVIMVIISPVFLSKTETDEDGNLKIPPGSNVIVAAILNVIRYCCLVAMYGGAIAVIVATHMMKPSVLPPYDEPEYLVPGGVPPPPSPVVGVGVAQPAGQNTTSAGSFF